MQFALCRHEIGVDGEEGYVSLSGKASPITFGWVLRTDSFVEEVVDLVVGFVSDEAGFSARSLILVILATLIH